MYGPECSGKTTLARALTEIYSGVIVEEFLRTYAQKIWDTEKRTVAPQDIEALIQGQCRAEKEGLIQAKSTCTPSSDQIDAHRVQCCPTFMDTNIDQLAVYFSYYFGPDWGQIPPHLKAADDAIVYLLTKPDIPWQSDDLRDQPLQRDSLFSIFEHDLIQKKARYHVVHGSHNQRINQACTFINKTWPELYVQRS